MTEQPDPTPLPLFGLRGLLCMAAIAAFTVLRPRVASPTIEALITLSLVGLSALVVRVVVLMRIRDRREQQ